MQPYFDLAGRLGLSPATLALAFVNDRWFVGSNIIGATTMDQLREDIASADVTLPADALAEIDRIHAACLEPAQ
jgi:aryl-alcohol dehydrogenase-like predicted oxidoreductase